MKLCGRCGEEKVGPIKQGQHYCTPCTEALNAYLAEDEHRRSHCKRCGGPKGEVRKKGQKYCPACKEAVAAERFAARTQANVCARCEGPKVPEGQKAKRGQKFCDTCRPIALKETEDRARARYKAKHPGKPRVRKPKVVKPKVAKPYVEPPKKLVVPKEIETAWKRAGAGSQFKRLCPKRSDLVRRYGVYR